MKPQNLILLLIITAFTACTKTTEQLTKSATVLPKMVGADISFLPQLESLKIYDEIRGKYLSK